MAHKKAGGSSRNGRDSAGKRLGVIHTGGRNAHATTRTAAHAQRNRQNRHRLISLD